ncbi:sensor histidine kinase [Paenibacillus sp.]|jgi:signal transduction histidine kinase|uniref:sensor histidine kinase n=1 Tax=Paenibacillus sp. TaxID=58172 RepID=UPI0028331077|nr:sensor histidine kinase [Paenibacillus sp.]MDR0267154.1 sensor histidine kinase [Paenibacillus sp.]
MRLFIREQIPLLLFYAGQMFLVGVWYWLAVDEHSWLTVVYGTLLSFVMLLLYLAYRYYTQRKLYVRLETPLGKLDQSLNQLGETPMAEAVSDMLREQFQLYKNELYSTQMRLDNHTAFINRWVHQMKTPVSVLQLTLQDLDVEDEVADGMQEEIDRLRKGLEMALYTSRLDKFEQDFKVESIPLLDAVEQAVAANRQWFIRKEIYPEIQIPLHLSTISDAKWLAFMLGQVIVNAVNYSAGVGKKVVFKAYQQGPHTVLEIRDEGIGIAKEDLGRVFEPYFTGNQGRQYHESTGMGLFLVREVCLKLDHRVEMESVPSEGTTVRFTFNNSDFNTNNTFRALR